MIARPPSSRLLLLWLALLCASAPCAQPKGSTTSAAKAGPPAKAAPRKAPLTDAAGQNVARALERVLRARVSSGGGPLRLFIRPTMRSRDGYFKQISLVARPARVRKLAVSELSLNALEVRIDVPALLNEGRVRTLESRTSLRAVVSEDDVTALLARGKSTREMGLRVRYNADGSMRVTGNLNYPLLSGPVAGVARLRVTSDYKVNLDISSLKLRGAEVPGFVRQQLMDRVNPVINYEDVPFRPRLSSLSVQGTRAILKT